MAAWSKAVEAEHVDPTWNKDYGELLDMAQARSSFGRIAAQTAKQVLLQRVRDAERDIIYGEFKDKQGELIRGIVHRFERGHSIVVDLGTAITFDAVSATGAYLGGVICPGIGISISGLFMSVSM